MPPEKQVHPSDKTDLDLSSHAIMFVLEIGVFTLFMFVLSFYVLPEFRKIFGSIGGMKLPEITLMLLTLGSFSQTVPLIPLIPSIVFLILGWICYSHKTRIGLIAAHSFFILFATIIGFLSWFGLVMPMIGISEAVEK